MIPAESVKSFTNHNRIYHGTMIPAEPHRIIHQAWNLYHDTSGAPFNHTFTVAPWCHGIFKRRFSDPYINLRICVYKQAKIVHIYHDQVQRNKTRLSRDMAGVHKWMFISW